MTNYVQVPVPAHLVADVMAWIVERDQGQPTKSNVPADAPPTPEFQESREWTKEQFELLAASDAPSVQLFAKVLNALAAAGPEGLPLSTLAEATGIEGLTMQKKFGAVTRWMRNRGMDNRWPIYWPKGNWAMTPTNAERWAEAKS